MRESTQQFQKSSAQFIDRLETQLSQLFSIYRNEETLSYQPLTNPNSSNSINLTHDSCCFRNQDSYTTFLEHPLEETSHLEKSIEILQGPRYNFKNLLLSLSIGWKYNWVNWSTFIGMRKLSYQPLINPDISNSSDLTQNSYCFGNQDSYTPILEHPLEKISHLEKSIEILQESAL